MGFEDYRKAINMGNTFKSADETFSASREAVKDDTGVLIVADGGNDSAVCEKLIRAASVALGVSPHKIEVFERK